jgi:hypothetical protein
VPPQTDAAATSRRLLHTVGAIVPATGGALIAERCDRERSRRAKSSTFGMHSVDGCRFQDGRPLAANASAASERTASCSSAARSRSGTALDPPQVFTATLERRLNELRPTPGFCVLNFAQEGYAFDQKFAVASIEVPRYRPALIMWEDWVEWSEYRMIGDTAYAIGDLAVRGDGFIGLAGVPDQLNRLFFLHSRLYEYLVLVYGERMQQRVGGPNGIELFANTRLSKVPPLAQSVGAKLVFYLAPPLDQPFAETAASLPDWHAILVDFAKARGIRVSAAARAD